MLLRQNTALMGHTSLQEGWCKFCHNPHVRSEFSALMYLAVALATAWAGLIIAPVVCGIIAVCLMACDIASCVHKRQQ